MKYYTYLIGWSKHDKWYYGARYGRKSDPNQLWKTYFTSSQYVKACRLLYGEPDVVEIRKVFDVSLEAKRWETKVLIRLGAVESERWLNKTVSNGYPINRTGVSTRGSGWKHTEETKKKIGNSNRGKKIPCSAARKEKLRQYKGKMVHNYKMTEYTFTNGVEVFTGTMSEFCEKYNLFKSNVCHMISGKNKSVRGWVLQ